MSSLTLDQPWLGHQRKSDKRRDRITGQSEDGCAGDVSKCQGLAGLNRQLPEIQRPPLLNLRFDVVLFTHRDATGRDDAIRLSGRTLQRVTNLIGIIGEIAAVDHRHPERSDLGSETKAIAVEDLAGMQIATAGLTQFVSGRQHGDVERPKDGDRIQPHRGQQANILRSQSMPRPHQCVPGLNITSSPTDMLPRLSSR
ncbi:MAG: Uncharacterised protein [Halieaceae bacterium]|nr:MAG: Uncharacterised protein [Halieaceae bacterium]